LNDSNVSAGGNASETDKVSSAAAASFEGHERRLSLEFILGVACPLGTRLVDVSGYEEMTFRAFDGLRSGQVSFLNTTKSIHAFKRK
jgi:hypothetical protein